MPTTQTNEARRREPDSRPAAAASLLEASEQAIMGKTVELALRGDKSAIRLCIQQIAARRRAAPAPCRLPPLEKPADAVAAMRAIAASLERGELTAAAALRLAKVVDVYVSALAAGELAERLARLERIGAPALTRLAEQLADDRKDRAR
jgi:hypothetical protein